MKYYLIAGEASGDLHGSNLMRELKNEDPEARFRCLGGDLMQKAGGEIVIHYREMAFMGILNVVLNIRTIRRNLELCKKDLQNYRPDVVILIDYPGFNLRIAEFAKKQNLRVFYYISPKVWAWKEHRVKKLKAFVDEIFTILPFETQFFKKHGMDVHYTGNPLIDTVNHFKKEALPRNKFLKKNNLEDRPLLALLAGSRTQEIRHTLPLMKKILRDPEGFQVVVAGVSSVEKDLYKKILRDANVPVLFDQTYDLLYHAHSAVVASGTAALETALFEVPQVVIYKVEGGRLTDLIMRNFVLKSGWVSLPNIIMGREIIPELIQKEMTLLKVKKAVNMILFDQQYREKIIRDYHRLKKHMGEGNCSQRAARQMVAILNAG